MQVSVLDAQHFLFEISACIDVANIRDGVAQRIGEELAGERGFVLLQLRESTLCDDLATAATSARPYIDQMVCLGHRGIVVLDHDDGIAVALQLSQRTNQ